MSSGRKLLVGENRRLREAYASIMSAADVFKAITVNIRFFFGENHKKRDARLQDLLDRANSELRTAIVHLRLESEPQAREVHELAEGASKAFSDFLSDFQFNQAHIRTVPLNEIRASEEKLQRHAEALEALAKDHLRTLESEL